MKDESRPYSELGDNHGQCEDRGFETPSASQKTYPVQVGGLGWVGWGTTWLCDACAEKRAPKFELSGVPQASRKWLMCSPGYLSTDVDRLALEAAKERLAVVNARSGLVVGAGVLENLGAAATAYAAGRASVEAPRSHSLTIDGPGETRSAEHAVECAECGMRSHTRILKRNGVEAVSGVQLWISEHVEPDEDMSRPLLHWCSAACFDAYQLRAEVRSDWFAHRPARRSHDVGRVDDDVAALLTEEARAELARGRAEVDRVLGGVRAERLAALCDAMAAEYGEDWRAVGRLTEEELS